MSVTVINQILFIWCICNPDEFESTLWKKGKDNKQFLKRIFLLSRKDFTLKYFMKEDVSSFFVHFWSYLIHNVLWVYLGYSQLSFCFQSFKIILSLRLPKMSSAWRTWMQFSSQRSLVTLTVCRSPMCRTNVPGICLFTMRTDRWTHLFISFISRLNLIRVY